MGQLNRPLGGAAEPSGLSGAPAPSLAFTRQVTHQPGGSFTQAAPPVPGTSGLPGAEPAGPATPPPSAGKPTGLHGMAGGSAVTMPSGLGGAPAAAPKPPAEDPDDPETPSGLPGR
jgi:hypothetical protein